MNNFKKLSIFINNDINSEVQTKEIIEKYQNQSTKFNSNDNVIKVLKIKKILLPFCIHLILTKSKQSRKNENIATNFRENNKNFDERK